MACPCHHKNARGTLAAAGEPIFPSCETVPADRAAELGPIRSPEDVYRVLGARAGRMKYERAWMLLLDPRKWLLVESEIGRGTETGVTIDLDWALACAKGPARTPYCVLAHNHPSGSAWPSMADARLTADMGAAAHRAGIELLDHVVLGRQEVFSFAFGQKMAV